MQTFIYGAGHNGNVLLQLIREFYSDRVNVAGYIDENVIGEENGLPIFRLDQVTADCLIIIAIVDFSLACEICKKIKNKGIRDIYWFSHARRAFGRDFFAEQLIDCRVWHGDMMRQAEMHVMDACNLNCRGCTHFSPIFLAQVPDFSENMGNIVKLKRKVSHIVTFYLLGGEPFLNSDIGKYAYEVRKLLPYTEIVIVTNGLLIPFLSLDILRAIRKCNIHIIISEYKPTRMMIDKISQKLDEFEIIYDIRSYEQKQKFNKPLSLSPNSKYPFLCISNGCITVGKNKIARCPTLLYIDEFNDFFGTHLPNSGIISLDDDVCKQQLLDKLREKVPLCQHCIKNEISWHVCGRIVTIDDFAVKD